MYSGEVRTELFLRTTGAKGTKKLLHEGSRRGHQLPSKVKTSGHTRASTTLEIKNQWAYSYTFHESRHSSVERCGVNRRNLVRLPYVYYNIHWTLCSIAPQIRAFGTYSGPNSASTTEKKHSDGAARLPPPLLFSPEISVR